MNLQRKHTKTNICVLNESPKFQLVDANLSVSKRKLFKYFELKPDPIGRVEYPLEALSVKLNFSLELKAE